MIKIIKEGKIPKLKKRIYEAACDYCGCRFEFETEDIKFQEKKLNEVISSTVECPCCHKDITQALFKYREVEE